MKHILIFAGTTEGRELMEKIKHFQVEVFVSVATEYGKECLLKEPEKERTVSTKHGEVQAGNLNIIAGRMKEVEMKRYMEKQAVDLVVDANHPFAREVTKISGQPARKRISYLKHEIHRRKMRESATFLPWRREYGSLIRRRAKS